MRLQKRPKKIQPKLKSRFEKRRDYDYLAWIRNQPCCLAGRHQCLVYPDRRRVEPAHLKTKGSGGYDRNNCLPCCPGLADESEGKMKHRLTEEKYGVNWQEMADEYTDRYLRERGEA
jgi:hypothetical protein